MTVGGFGATIVVVDASFRQRLWQVLLIHPTRDFALPQTVLIVRPVHLKSGPWVPFVGRNVSKTKLNLLSVLLGHTVRAFLDHTICIKSTRFAKGPQLTNFHIQIHL